MVFTPAILAALTVAFATTISAVPPYKREASDNPCRIEGLFVGGTPLTGGYIENVHSEQQCIDACNAHEKCHAVNYFPDHKACLPQEEAFQGEEKDRLASGTITNTVYIIVKGCEAKSQSQKREKRDAKCKLEDVLVGGSVVNNKYIENIATEEACIEECQKLEACNAVNYWPEYGDCLPQIETLANPQERDGLASREEEGTNYIVVKGCNEGIEKPANILPPAEHPKSSESSEKSEEASKSSEKSDEKSAEASDESSKTRRKREVNCRLENVLVGGSVVNDEYIENVASEEDCIKQCQDLVACNAVNYFPKHQACLPQMETLADSIVAQLIASREEKGTVYVVVKGCTEDIHRPDNILPPVESGEDESKSSEKSEGKESSEKSEESENTGSLIRGEPDKKETRFKPLFGTFPFGRKKRNTPCRQEKLLVGGGLVEDPIENVESEEDCIKACKETEKCQAVNYFPEHKVCWRQEEALDGDNLEKREDELANYVIVKGCDN